MNKKSGKTSLFLIDDESDLTTTYSEILSDRYDVKTFNSAESALDALDTESPPDIFISDIKMKKMSGIDLLSELRLRNCNSHFILISGCAQLEHLTSAIQNNVVGFLEKPFRPEKLIDEIEKIELSIEDHKKLQNMAKEFQSVTVHSLELISLYRDRFIFAENVLYENEINPHQDLSKVKIFLDQISNEKKLEDSIERSVEKIKRFESLPAEEFNRVKKIV